MSESVALGANVGAAWVALRFSARGAATQIRSQLAAETAGLGASLGDSTGSKFKSSFGRRMSGLGATVRSALAPAVKYGTLAFAAMGAESVHMATEFQSSMLKVRTQAGASQKEVNKMSQAILNMAAHTQDGPQRLSEALYHLESLGLRGAKALDALRTSEQLANVSGADLEETTNAIGGAWRTGIRGAKSFIQSASTLNAIVGAGNMRMSDLLGALGTGILPSAKTFGLSLGQVGAALALFTDEGVPAVDAATRLRMSFSLLGAPSKLAEKELNSIGITGLQLANAMRSPGGLIAAISLLKDHLDKSGLSASRQAELLSRAFGGGRSSSSILSMLNNLDVLRKKQDQVNASTGKFGDAVKAQAKTASAAWHLMVSNIDVLMIRLGSALLPPFTSFIRFLGSTVIPDVGKAGRAIGRLIPVGAIERDLRGITGFVGDFLNGLTNKTVSPKVNVRPMLKLAPGAKDAFMSHMRAGFGASENWVTPLDTMGPPQAANAYIHSLQASAGAAAQSGASKLGQQLRDSISGAFSHLNWSKMVADAIRAAVGAANQIGAAFLTLLEKVNWLQVGKEAAFSLVPFVIGLVNNLMQAIISEAVHHPIDMVMFITSLIPIGRGAGAILKVFGEIKFIGPLLKLLLGPIEKAGGLAEKAFGGILKKIFGPIVRKIAPYFSTAATWLKGAGETLILKLWYGIEGAWAPVARWFAGFGGRVGGYFGKSASWLLSKGQDILLGLARGAGIGWRAVGRWLGGVFGRIAPYFRTAGSWLLGKGQDTLLGLARGAGIGWRTVAGWFGGIGGRIGSFFAKAGTWLFRAGTDIISGLLSGIADKMKGIGSWIWANVASPVINWIKHHFGIHSPSVVMHGIGFNLIAGLIRGIVTANPLGLIKDVFSSLPSALAHLVEDGILNIAKLPGRVLSILGGLGGDLGHLFGDIGSLFGGGGVSGGVKQWAGLVSKVLGMLGLPGSYLGPWLAQMQTESGGRPNAINLTDSNAKAGDPSRGLLQVIGGTFASYAGPFRSLGIYNPLANIYAAINYALHRYGRLGMLSVIGHGHGYDSGGIASGVGFLPKYTPKPERVLSPQQTMAFERLVDTLSGKTGDPSGPLRIADAKVTFDPRNLEMWIRDISVQEARAEITFRSG
jgi:TP901 family phage tail tape measure protein